MTEPLPYQLLIFTQLETAAHAGQYDSSFRKLKESEAFQSIIAMGEGAILPLLRILQAEFIRGEFRWAPLLATTALLIERHPTMDADYPLQFAGQISHRAAYVLQFAAKKGYKVEPA